MECQTEQNDQADMQTQAPEDLYVQGIVAGPKKSKITDSSANSTTSVGTIAKISSYSRGKKKANEALNLEKFMGRACPVMEQVINEADQIYFLMNKMTVAKKSSVDLKTRLKLP